MRELAVVFQLGDEMLCGLCRGAIPAPSGDEIRLDRIPVKLVISLSPLRMQDALPAKIVAS